MTRYRQKPDIVYAQKVGAKGKDDLSIKALADWCEGQIIKDGNRYAGIALKPKKRPYGPMVPVGHWLVETDEGFVGMTDAEFHKRYERA